MALFAPYLSDSVGRRQYLEDVCFLQEASTLSSLFWEALLEATSGTQDLTTSGSFREFATWARGWSEMKVEG